MKFKKFICSFLSFLMLIGNPAPFLLLLASTPIRIGLPVFLTSLAFSTKAKASSIIESLTRKYEPPMLPPFSAKPTDEEFGMVRAFDELLVPTSEYSNELENRDLVTALYLTVNDPKDESLQHLEDFAVKYPGGRWVLAVELNRGITLNRRGYFSMALEAFKAAWRAGRDELNISTKKMADRALAELMRMNCQMGRSDEAQRLLEKLTPRHPEGLAVQYIEAANYGVWMMKHHPEQSFLCGPYGLKQILAFEKSSKADSPILTKAKSTDRGLSLAYVWKLSQKLGMGLQIAKRKPGAKVLLPALVSWKLDHFAALVEEKNSLYHSVDPTFGNETWVSEKALDEESSGYCLVREGELPEGWEKVELPEARMVLGRGGFQPGHPNQSPTDPTACPLECSCGMPRVNIDIPLAAAMMDDTPLKYQPPVGRAIEIHLSYHQKASNSLIATGLPYSTFGPDWSFNWQGSIQYTFNAGVASNYKAFPPGGGEEDNWTPVLNSNTQYTRANIQTSSTYNDPKNDPLKVGLPSSFVRQLPDGSSETYGFAVAGVSSVQIFLTKLTDPQGNVTTITYKPDLTNRINYITDPLGQKTTFIYGLETVPDSNNQPLGYPIHKYLITQVMDPFGRHADFNYNNFTIDLCNGAPALTQVSPPCCACSKPYTFKLLGSITDQMGLTSSFTWNFPPNAFPIGWVKSLTTPYGTTSFDYTGNNGNNAYEILVTDPMGLKQHVQFNFAAPLPPVPEDVSGNSPPGATFQSGQGGNYLVTHYWDKKAMEDAPDSLSSATEYRWLMDMDGGARTLSFLPMNIKRPLTSRVWFNYQNQQTHDNTGDSENSTTFPIPSDRIRFLADGTTQEVSRTYNSFGRVTSATDPSGRQIFYTYAPNGFDLVKVEDGSGGVTQDTLAQFTNYNSKHEPQNVTDAANQNTSYSFDTNTGKITSVTSPMIETTTYNYDPITKNLMSIIPPQQGAQVTFTYDSLNRVQTRTDSIKGTIRYFYDNGDRVNQVNYPDGSFEKYTYDRLELESFRDRQGRTTSYLYDSDRRLVKITDPKTQTTQYGWCSCGSMESMTDPKGNITRFERDLLGRMSKKTYMDGSFYQYIYDNGVGNLTTMIDPNNQTTQYKYAVNNKLTNIDYLNPVNSTPPVVLTYEPFSLGRIQTMKDGTGTTSYAYYPFGNTEGGQLKSSNQPVGGSMANIVYHYDNDSRVVSRAIDTVTETYGFNAQGQLFNVTNTLGVGGFGYTYDPTSARLTTVSYPNNQQTKFDYFSSTDPLGASGALKDINNLSPSSQILSKFTYAYNATREIKTWQQQLGTATNAYTMGYDLDSELQAVTMTSGTNGFDGMTANQSVTYGYDAAGNRTVEKTPNYSNAFGTNNLNELTNITPKPIPVKGITNRAGTITVNGTPVPEDVNNQYQTSLAPAAGTSTPLTVQAVATDGSVTITRKKVLNTQPFVYDANGNLIRDDQKSYAWDAANRLVKVAFLSPQPTGVADTILMSYDGLGRRVGITELHGLNTLSTKTFVWCGLQLCQERDSSGASVAKQFFTLGEKIMTGPNVGNYYFTKDHLGSVREMVDSNGVVQARYDYDPWGRQTKIMENVAADFGYTGFYMNRSSGLDLTLFRVYDPEKGRWLSRDPFGERMGLNLFAYVMNNSLKWRDVLGLSEDPWDYLVPPSPSGPADPMDPWIPFNPEPPTVPYIPAPPYVPPSGPVLPGAPQEPPPIVPWAPPVHHPPGWPLSFVPGELEDWNMLHPEHIQEVDFTECLLP